MQAISCNFGQWRASADIHEVDDDKLMAVISVTEDDSPENLMSKHTVVFDHEEGRDMLEETKDVMEQLFSGRRRI